MTEEQKWLNKLERLLAKIPNSVEIIVEPVTVGHTGMGQVLMVPRGREFETFEDDMMFTSHRDVAIDSFYAKAITGNSESI